MDPLVVYTILAAFLCGFSGYSFIRGVQEINNGNKKFRVNLPCSKGGRGKRKSRRKNRKTTNVRPTSSDSTLTNKSSRKKKKRSKKLRKASGSVAMFTCPCLYYCLLRGSDSESDKSKRKKSSHVMKGVRNCCCCCCCDFTSSDDDTCWIISKKYCFRIERKFCKQGSKNYFPRSVPFYSKKHEHWYFMISDL